MVICNVIKSKFNYFVVTHLFECKYYNLSICFKEIRFSGIVCSKSEKWENVALIFFFFLNQDIFIINAIPKQKKSRFAEGTAGHSSRNLPVSKCFENIRLLKAMRRFPLKYVKM